MKQLLATILAGSLLLSVCVLMAAENTDPKGPAYIGVRKCKTCHKKKAKGNQYGKWQDLRHSKSWETLATDKAKKIARAKGIDDPQKSDKCTKCHIAGGHDNNATFGSKYTKEEGVSCEACHGPGENYKKLHKKKETLEDAKKAGLVLPDESTCLKCHNEESPTFKKEEWDFKKKLKIIDHDNPKVEGNRFVK